MRYLSYSELIFINGKILNDEQIMAGKQKIRDIDLLLAAAARPQASAFGADAYPTLREKAAALMHSIARNHPFKDGNKRTATLAMVFMLEVNGQRVRWTPTEALDMIMAVAEGTQEMTDLAAWLVLDAGEAFLEPDIDRDTQHIDRLLREHRWLLNELAGR